VAKSGQERDSVGLVCLGLRAPWILDGRTRQLFFEACLTGPGGPKVHTRELSTGCVAHVCVTTDVCGN
jgi:hypothetical protein